MQHIAAAWQADLRHILSTQTLTVTDVRIGIFFTAARLSSGHVGVAFTPREANASTRPVRSAPYSSRPVESFWPDQPQVVGQPRFTPMACMSWLAYALWMRISSYRSE
jgi:hypothetical protein